MHVPCSTCKQRGVCQDEEITTREAVFEWLAGRCMGCEDYVEDCYHGVEGVVNVRISDGSGSTMVRGFRSGGGLDVRRFHYVPLLYLGTK
jgi:hypothetical protein